MPPPADTTDAPSRARGRDGRRPRHDCFAVCTPGLEEVLATELAALGVGATRPATGGLGFRASTRQLYAANLWLRTANRVLVRVATFPATSFRTLEARAEEVPWHRWLDPRGERRPHFRVTSTASKLYHTDAVAERLVRVTDSLAGTGRAGGGDGDDRDEQLFVVRVDHDKVTVSVDSSGAPLHQRGWRGPQGKAPLRETLAAALLICVGWDGTVPLVDPFCGSGTIPIEAAMLARGLAPGWQRSFAFGEWPSFEPGTWASVAADAAGRAAPSGSMTVPVWGGDRDAGVIEAARENAERAGVGDDVVFERATVSDLVPPSAGDDDESGGAGGPGWVITNPPYGKRAGGGDLRNLYARLGQVTRTALPGWRVGMLVADRRLAHHTGLSLHEALRTTNGGIEVHLLAT